jgi:ParB-like chromosome segregation protein Spo0J
MLRIDTMADFEAWRAGGSEGAYITSKTRGRIPVPCLRAVLVRAELVVENFYNPNSVSPDKMELLLQSVLDNGFCFPIVTVFDPEQRLFVVIDGAHRKMVLGPDWLDCDYLPVVVLPHDLSRRLAATWQFNKARGVHQVDLDADLIRRMCEQGMEDEQIALALGVDLDTIYRYKQVTGVAELFRNVEFSGAWEMVDED